MRYVLQYSVDIEADEADVSEEQIAEAIENALADVSVLGCSWQASWTTEGYENGESPISSN